MGLDIKKLRNQQAYINMRAREEKLVNYILSSNQIEKYIEFEKSRKKVEHSARVLNNWAEQGVISQIETGKKRTYNKQEAIWIDIVSQLREFGLSLVKIKKVKQSLCENQLEGSEFSPLKYSLIYSLMIEPYILIVYNDGSINLMSKSQYESYLKEEFILPVHICINMLSVSESEFPKNNFADFVNKSDITLLSEKELELLYYLRTGEYDEIKVRMKDGDIYLIESSSKINVNSKVIDIINSSSYQDIEIKVRDNKTVFIQRTEIKK